MLSFADSRLHAPTPNTPTTRNDVIEALQAVGWHSCAPSPITPAERFLEFRKGEGEVCYVYEEEVLFGNDAGGGAGYRGFEEAVALIWAN